MFYRKRYKLFLKHYLIAKFMILTKHFQKRLKERKLKIFGTYSEKPANRKEYKRMLAGKDYVRVCRGENVIVRSNNSLITIYDN